MTTPDNSGPIAPRRPLAKQAGGPPRPGQRGPAGSATATAPDAAPAGDPAAAPPPRETSPKGEATVGPTSNGVGRAIGSVGRDGRPSNAPAGMVPQVAAPRPASSSTEPYYPPYEPRSSLDVETQPAIPIPPGLAPVPPAPRPAAPDKKVERAAARARRKIEASRPRTIRRAKLRIVRVDPWSVTKTAFLLSIAFGIMCVVAVFLIFSIMSASGLWDSVNTTIQGVVDQRPSEAFDIKDYVGMSRVMGITMLVAAIDVVIITALATLGAFIYNMSASLLGGIEVTLAEDLH
jgi:transmembrane protein DUF3566